MTFFFFCLSRFSDISFPKFFFFFNFTFLWNNANILIKECIKQAYLLLSMYFKLASCKKGTIWTSNIQRKKPQHSDTVGSLVSSVKGVWERIKFSSISGFPALIWYVLCKLLLIKFNTGSVGYCIWLGAGLEQNWPQNWAVVGCYLGKIEFI